MFQNYHSHENYSNSGDPPDIYESPFNMYPPTEESTSSNVNDINGRAQPQQKTPYPVSEDNIPMSSLSIAENHQSDQSRRQLQPETLSQSQRQEQGSEQRQIEQPNKRIRDLSEYSPRALEFFKIYEETINDVKIFTPDVQMRWCEMLLSVSQENDFISHYTINAERLKRELTANELQRNRKIIIEHAFKILTALIKLKYANAYYLMGCLYSHKVSHFSLIKYDFINQNDSKALDYYCEAAKLGHSDSSFRAGVSFEFGKGTKGRDLDEIECLKLAFQYYENGAINCNNCDCMFKMGMFYLNGKIDKINQINPINTDCNIGIGWLEKAVKFGESSQACFELGKIYEFNGLNKFLQERLIKNGIKKDNKKSLSYYYKCATKFDYSLAQWKLGYYYEFGEAGLPIDGKKSIGWYLRASTEKKLDGKKKNASPMAMLSLGGWFFTGIKNVLLPDYEESFKWVYKSCQISEGKSARAEFVLGYYYLNGIGCAVNLNNARSHLNQASQLGHARAIEILNNWPHGPPI